MDLKEKANPREQVLGFLVIIALFVMFLRVLYFPKRGEAQGFRGQIQNLKLEKEALTKFTEALIQATQKTGPDKQKNPLSLSVKLRVLRGELPSVTEETAPLLSLLTSPQFLTGITIKSMSDLPPKKEEGYQKSSFFMNAQGSFPHIIQYLEKIEQVPALMAIDNVALKTIDTRASEVDLELNGTLFQMKDKNGTK